MVVLKTSLSEANRKKFIETVKDWLKDAKFTKEEEWGEKTLAYVVKKENSGFFQNFIFEAKDETITGIEKKLLASDNVLRHLLLRQK